MHQQQRHTSPMGRNPPSPLPVTHTLSGGAIAVAAIAHAGDARTMLEGFDRFRDAAEVFDAFEAPGDHRSCPQAALLFDSLTDDLIEAAQATGTGDERLEHDMSAVIDAAISRPRPSL
ncbi:hypothetical protein [Rhodococcus jostii]|jgi:hypothetical protein|nr:hypothetical protein [Rhodococcus jostii]